ncbi:MAG: MFS transporter [Acetobacteraceae bacterium]|nr:MFS transporter [Acetobacteraceae bacterium]MBV8525273.1 MFS transporter [Acetobacteraceae bacterium]
MSETDAPEPGRQKLPLALLATAGFLSSAGARVMDPLMPAIARDFGVSVPEVSVVIAAFTLPYGLNQIVLGPVGDRFGKLRVILAALIGYAVFTNGCALALNLMQLTVLRALAGAASAGLIPVCLAYIGDAVPYHLRQVTLSRFLAGVVLAQVAAAPLGGIFGDYLSWRGVFVLLAVAAGILALVLAFRMRNLPDRRGEVTFALENYMLLAKRPGSRRLLLATAIEGGLMAGSFPFLAPYLHDSFGLSYALVGLVVAAFGVGAFAFTQLAKPIVHALGEARMVLAGGGLMAMALALGMASPVWQVFAAAELVLGFAYVMLHTVLQARATELLPHARTTAVSSFVFMLFLGQGIGALLLGAAIAAWGYRTAFWIDAAAIALLSLWIASIVRLRPHSS